MNTDAAMVLDVFGVISEEGNLVVAVNYRVPFNGQYSLWVANFTIESNSSSRVTRSLMVLLCSVVIIGVTIALGGYLIYLKKYKLRTVVTTNS